MFRFSLSKMRQLINSSLTKQVFFYLQSIVYIFIPEYSVITWGIYCLALFLMSRHWYAYSMHDNQKQTVWWHPPDIAPGRERADGWLGALLNLGRHRHFDVPKSLWEELSGRFTQLLSIQAPLLSFEMDQDMDARTDCTLMLNADIANELFRASAKETKIWYLSCGNHQRHCRQDSQGSACCYRHRWSWASLPLNSAGKKEQAMQDRFAQRFEAASQSRAEGLNKKGTVKKSAQGTKYLW